MNNMLTRFSRGRLQPRTQFHYAWVIVLIASAMRLTGTAIRISFSVLVPHMVNVFGWSFGAVGLAFSLQWIFSGVFGPMAGWFGDRFGMRRTMLVGILLFMGSMLLTGYVTQLWQFYLVFGILLSGSMSVFQVPVVPAVSIWFKKHLGVSMGMLESSQGLGPLILVPLIPLILDHLGWSWAFWLPGLVGGAILLLSLRFFHNEPAEMGLRPLGASKDEPIQSLQRGAVARLRTQAFLEQARRTGTFWNLIGIHFWGCAGHAVVLVFLVTIAVERGIPLAAAGIALTLLHVTSSISRFAVPVVSDRLGSKGAMTVCFVMQVAPILLLMVANEAWIFYLFCILFGIGFGGEMSAFPIINQSILRRCSHRDNVRLAELWGRLRHGDWSFGSRHPPGPYRQLYLHAGLLHGNERGWSHIHPHTAHYLYTPDPPVGRSATSRGPFPRDR